jgi:hypothetical protein
MIWHDDVGAEEGWMAIAFKSQLSERKLGVFRSMKSSAAFANVKSDKVQNTPTVSGIEALCHADSL